MERSALRRRAAAVLVSYGVSGFTVRVGSIRAAAWAHCDFTRREIVFDPMLLGCDWVFANQIILHEVAHAIAGPQARHGRKWLDTARAMGYRLGAKVPRTDPQTIPHHWAVTCATGAHSAIKHERTYPDGAKLCRPCYESGGGEVMVFWEAL